MLFAHPEGRLRTVIRSLVVPKHKPIACDRNVSNELFIP